MHVASVNLVSLGVESPSFARRLAHGALSAYRGYVEERRRAGAPLDAAANDAFFARQRNRGFQMGASMPELHKLPEMERLEMHARKWGAQLLADLGADADVVDAVRADAADFSTRFDVWASLAGVPGATKGHGEHVHGDSLVSGAFYARAPARSGALVLAGVARPARAGDLVVFPSNVPHSVQATALHASLGPWRCPRVCLAFNVAHARLTADDVYQVAR